jgi:hypothetical protein
MVRRGWRPQSPSALFRACETVSLLTLEIHAVNIQRQKIAGTPCDRRQAAHATSAARSSGAVGCVDRQPARSETHPAGGGAEIDGQGPCGRNGVAAGSSMNVPTAIVLASVLAGLSIVGATVGNHFLENHDELAATAVGDTNLPWRLNTRTGAIVVCELAKNPLAPGGGNQNSPGPSIPSSSYSRYQVRTVSSSSNRTFATSPQLIPSSNDTSALACRASR